MESAAKCRMCAYELAAEAKTCPRCGTGQKESISLSRICALLGILLVPLCVIVFFWFNAENKKLAFEPAKPNAVADPGSVLPDPQEAEEEPSVLAEVRNVHEFTVSVQMWSLRQFMGDDTVYSFVKDLLDSAGFQTKPMPLEVFQVIDGPERQFDSERDLLRINVLPVDSSRGAVQIELQRQEYVGENKGVLELGYEGYYRTSYQNDGPAWKCTLGAALNRNDLEQALTAGVKQLVQVCAKDAQLAQPGKQEPGQTTQKKCEIWVDFPAWKTPIRFSAYESEITSLLDAAGFVVSDSRWCPRRLHITATQENSQAPAEVKFKFTDTGRSESWSWSVSKMGLLRQALREGLDEFKTAYARQCIAKSE